MSKNKNSGIGCIGWTIFLLIGLAICCVGLLFPWIFVIGLLALGPVGILILLLMFGQ